MTITKQKTKCFICGKEIESKYETCEECWEREYGAIKKAWDKIEEGKRNKKFYPNM